MQILTFFLSLTITIHNINCTLYWEKIVDSLSYNLPTKPPPRRDAAIAYDIERNRIVLFGGRQTMNGDLQAALMPVLFDDTWEFSLETRLWRKLSHSIQRPSPRYGMLYSHNKNGLYVTCGRGWLDEYFNDLWVYDFRNDKWQQMDQTYISIVPDARHGAFGGMYPSYESKTTSSSNFYLAHGSSQFYMHDTMYTYIFTDLYGVNGIWEKIYTEFLTGPYGFAYPHAREFASSAMISKDELLVYGGCLSGGFSGGPCPSSDSWIYSYSNSKWSKVDSSCISPRKQSAMASLVSDGVRHASIMFSGEETDRTILKTDREKESEVAIFDGSTKKWFMRKTQGFYFPEKRDGHMMCSGSFDGQYGVFVFGGYGHQSHTNMADLWFLKANITEIFNNQMISMMTSTSKCATYFSTVHLHAIVMFIGWGVFMNIKCFLQRYAQVNKKNVYMANRIATVLEGSGILIITVGIGFGFYSSHGLPSLPHVIIGVIAYICIILQQIASHLRKVNKNDYIIDEKEDPLNKYDCFLFNTIHQNSGTIGLLLGVVNISMGIFYAVLEWYWIVVWFSLLGINLIIYGCLEVVNFLNYSADVAKNSKINDYESQSNYSHLSLNESTMKESKFIQDINQSHTQIESRYVMPSDSPFVRPVEKKAVANRINDRPLDRPPSEKEIYGSSVDSRNNNQNAAHGFAKVNNISTSNLQKLNRYQNSRENLVSSINLKYYL